MPSRRSAPRSTSSRSSRSPHLALARIYALERQPSLARQHAEIGSQRDPAQGFEIQAALMMDAARLDQAEAFAKRSLEADPARYMSEYLLGVIAQQRAKCSDAIPHFERAIEGKRVEPRAVVRNLHAGLADCLARTGREADAEREFKAELAVIPDSPEARRGLAALYSAQGRDREASALGATANSYARPELVEGRARARGSTSSPRA